MFPYHVFELFIFINIFIFVSDDYVKAAFVLHIIQVSIFNIIFSYIHIFLSLFVLLCDGNRAGPYGGGHHVLCLPFVCRKALAKE